MSRKLGISYVDLYLIHFPRLVKDNMEAAWAKFGKSRQTDLQSKLSFLFQMGLFMDLSRSIGVSNFSIENQGTTEDGESCSCSELSERNSHDIVSTIHVFGE